MSFFFGVKLAFEMSKMEISEILALDDECLHLRPKGIWSWGFLNSQQEIPRYKNLISFYFITLLPPSSEHVRHPSTRHKCWMDRKVKWVNVIVFVQC